MDIRHRRKAVRTVACVTTRQRYGLFGHSAGGQFVHRMVSFGFRDRVAVAVSANAGTYAMPDLSTPWPFGLGQTDVDTDALRALLGFPITVMAGTADVETTGHFFPKGPRSMRQGANRYERAHTYVRSGHATRGGAGEQLCLDDNRCTRRGPSRQAHVRRRGANRVCRDARKWKGWKRNRMWRCGFEGHNRRRAIDCSQRVRHRGHKVIPVIVAPVAGIPPAADGRPNSTPRRKEGGGLQLSSTSGLFGIGEPTSGMTPPSPQARSPTRTR